MRRRAEAAITVMALLLIAARPAHADAPVVLGAIKIDGDLREVDVREAINERMPQLAKCYLKLLKKDPWRAGRVKATLSVAPRGTVAWVATDGEKKNPIDACVRIALGPVRLARSASGGDLEVIFELGPSDLIDIEEATPLHERPEVVIGKVSVERKLIDAGEARVAVLRHHGRFRQCYETALTKDDPKFAAKVSLYLRISEKGTIEEAKAEGAKDPEFELCLDQAAKKIQFPPDDFVVEINVPMKFSAL